MTPEIEPVLPRLKRILATQRMDQELDGLITAQDEVLARFQPLFDRNSLASMAADEFYEFLLLRNNKHWSGLHRMGPAITADVEALRGALIDLLDESKPITHRLSDLIPWNGGEPRVKRLGKAVLTAVLMVAHPDKYCVWNGTSEGAMRELGLWPDFERGASTGDRTLALYVTNHFQRLIELGDLEPVPE